jgi:hypothetical protein
MAGLEIGSMADLSRKPHGEFGNWPHGGVTKGSHGEFGNWPHDRFKQQNLTISQFKVNVGLSIYCVTFPTVMNC